MNDRDESLLRNIMSAMKDDVTGPVLFNVSSTQFVRINLVLLKGLMEERGMSGMFVSVDRPHQYMVHLLRMHRINLESVMFIDAIGQFSGDRKEAMAKVGFVDGPFHIDTLPEAIQNLGIGDGQKLDLDNCGFAMIDNLAALLPYNSYSSVEAFLRNFVGVMSAHRKAVIPLVIDSEKSGLLYETARSMCIKEIDARGDTGPSEVMNKSVRKISDFRYMEGSV